MLEAHKMKKEQAIGIFDSGIGGLTVAKALERALPNEHFIYFGDTEHMPYGDRSAEHIKAYTEKIVEFLIEKEVKVIVIACNSASAVAAGHLRRLYWEKVEIIGVIRPVLKEIVAQRVKKLGVIATQATVNSNIYPRLAQEYDIELDIFQLATPLLAPMIEEGLFGNEVSKAVLNEYLSNGKFADKEAILLACTHYPLIKNEVSAFFGGAKKIFDNAEPLANEVASYLRSNNLLASEKNKANQFYVSEITDHFERITQLFYGKEVKIKEVKL